MIRAHIQEEPATDSIDITIIRTHTTLDQDTERWVLHFTHSAPASAFWDPIPDDGRQPKPTLRLTNETALALLEALARHYHGTENTRTLRKDYEAERRRVDQLTAALAGVAQTLAEQHRSQHREAERAVNTHLEAAQP